MDGVIGDYLARHPESVERIVKDYLLKNPDVLQQALAELVKKRNAAVAADKAAIVRSHAEALFNSPRQVSLGNRDGDVTLVEFFDYNCGYCKRALADTLELMEGDSRLKIVLKEFPVLGPGSVEAARVAVAVRMQDERGDKYLAFHRKLMGERGQADRTRAMAVARELGFDMARIEQDADGPEAAATLEESSRLARALGLTGTPSYVVGDSVVVGAVGAATLKDRIRSARK